MPEIQVEEKRNRVVEVKQDTVYIDGEVICPLERILCVHENLLDMYRLFTYETNAHWEPERFGEFMETMFAAYRGRLVEFILHQLDASEQFRQLGEDIQRRYPFELDEVNEKKE